ncbi:MAG TPA: xanthine dehydrogenase family protein molybdopterin-binding subunit [Bryobacteraceae bacterium]|nr:xanthine dehydrogenase family protein molybdopterin-binding subunit [Bryobacteraceae bacterium]
MSATKENKYKYIGHDYSTPDLIAKVRGQSKYAEDFRADGMVFAKLALSQVPHARIRRLDARKALAMPGVLAILTADDVPVAQPGPEDPPPIGRPELALTNEPVYAGEPIFAIAAVDEHTAAEAVEAVEVDFEPLPFVIDPMDSLRPGGPNARRDGNVYYQNSKIKTIKWTSKDFEEVAAGRLPWGAQAGEEAGYGDVDAAFKAADYVIDETVFQQSTSHAPLEPRSVMAYWQNGKLYMFGSTQSLAQTVDAAARWCGIKPDQLVFVSEYCGGGFGGKINGAQTMAIPALLSKKVNRPVMMRISREEESFIGRVRPGIQGRIKIAFRKDGRILGMDMLFIEDAGPYAQQGDAQIAAMCASLLYQPAAVRLRALSIATNTAPRTSQRCPGGLQAVAICEPLVDKAARQLGIDRVQIRKINAPSDNSPWGFPEKPGGPRATVTSAKVREALDRGAEMFKWEERKKRSAQASGTKRRGVSVSVATFFSGSNGFDGLLLIKPDGKLYVHQGIGNLGTHSVMDTARVAAETLDMPWEKVEVVWGSTSVGVPWSSTQDGSQTTHAHSRANYAAALDAKAKLQEIAAKKFGGKPENYQVGNARVFPKGSPGGGMSFADAAKLAIQMGGKYDGHEVPKQVHQMTKDSVKTLAGQGLIGVAKDEFGGKGVPLSFVAGFAEVEVDIETGQYHVIDYLAVADVGTVLHPRALSGQLHGGAIQGLGHVKSQALIYDPHYGQAVAKRFHHTKPPTMLDIPNDMQWDAVNIADPQTPVGAKGVGEVAVAAGASTIFCAIADAVGEDYLRRTPIHPGYIVTSLETKTRTYHPLMAYI